MRSIYILLVILSVTICSYGFSLSSRSVGLGYGKRIYMSDGPKGIDVSIPLGDGYKPLVCNFKPLFQKSEFYTFTYPVPFSLNVEKPPMKKGAIPAPTVTAPGMLGDKGEQVGDVLRATTCWSQGTQAAGQKSDVNVYAGNLRWRKSVFDTVGAPWEKVVEALLSNTEERSSEVTLIFERPLE